jgi:TonB family protein
VHGRLKPSKVMVVQDQMKLPVDCLHRAGSLRKPPGEQQIYDAPEKATGTISAASDIWSLGITLVEALTQHSPLWDRSIKSDPVVPGSVPQPFADIARKCVRREPERRCTPREIQALLDPARPLPVKGGAIDEPIRSTPSKLSSEVIEATKSKRRVLLLIAAVVVLCIIVTAVLLHKTSPSPTAENRPTAPATAAAPTPAPVAPNQTSKTSSSKGEVAERVMPDISPGANRSIHGKFAVKVRVSVDAKGDVSNAVFDSHGPSRYFANQALQAARSWKFKAARADGQPVPSEWILRFEFRKNRTDCDPVEVTP